MTRNPFGWSYPPGAENDPNAPYNQVDDPNNDLLKAAFKDFASLSDLYRQTYRSTGCGPSVGVEIIRADGEIERIFCDDLQRLGDWDKLDEIGAVVEVLFVSSIVEGSDAEVPAIEIEVAEFDDPTKLAEAFEQTVKDVDAEASSLWHEANVAEDFDPNDLRNSP